MRNTTAYFDPLDQTQQLLPELLGPWYNYETRNLQLEDREFDHWLSRLETTEMNPRRELD